jgi:TPP-dependent pyruvate/acetoin dehydrogenase alpha subunit
MGHSKSDANVYRTKQEIEEWKKRCPIKRMRERLVSERIFTSEELDAIEVQSRADVDEAVRFAESSPSPRIEEAGRDVFA